jgi:hypothetical protein
MQWRLLSGEGGFERQSRRTKLHKIHSCFRATELVTWILCDLGLQSRTEVRFFASSLSPSFFFSSFSFSLFRTPPPRHRVITKTTITKREQAAAVGRDLMKENMLHHAKFQITEFIDGQSFYRLQWDSRVCSPLSLPLKHWSSAASHLFAHLVCRVVSCVVSCVSCVVC